MITFSHWKKDDYLTVVNKNLVKVYKNCGLEPIIKLKMIDKSITGAVYAENRIVITFQETADVIYQYDENGEVTRYNLGNHFNNIKVIKYLNGGSGHEYVLNIKDIDTNRSRFIIYDIEKQKEIAEIPMSGGLKDIEYYKNDSLLQLTKFCVDESRYTDDDDEMEYRIIMWDVESVGISKNYIEQKKAFKGYTGIYTTEKWEGGYCSQELSHNIHFPLFKYFLYYWPENLSVSAHGKFFLQFSKDIDGILIGSLNGEIKHCFKMPKGVTSKAHLFFNENENRLYVVENSVMIVYKILQNQEYIDQVNEMYDLTLKAQISVQNNREFEEIFYRCLHSANLELLCKHDI